MRFPERTITLKDGRKCILRPTAPEIAEEMLEYLKKTSGETPWLLRNPDEVTYTPEEEKKVLSSMLEDPYSAMMVALVDGKVAGNCAVNGIGRKRKIVHRCSMGIALYRDFWNLGLGSAMIGYLAELAKQIGYEQMDLEVIAGNTRAQALYRKCGFVESGRRHNAVKLDDGSCYDEILMYKEL